MVKSRFTSKYMTIFERLARNSISTNAIRITDNSLMIIDQVAPPSKMTFHASIHLINKITENRTKGLDIKDNSCDRFITGSPSNQARILHTCTMLIFKTIFCPSNKIHGQPITAERKHKVNHIIIHNEFVSINVPANGRLLLSE